jgi:hypothetical protein
MSPTPSERTIIGQIGAETKWALEPDRTAATAAARTAALARFEQQVDPDGVLDPADRAERAARLQRAHMKRLALKSAQARRAKAAGKAKK